MAALGADLQPSGWRLTDAPGVDHRRARSLLGQDLDGLEEHAEGYTGAFKIQVAGSVDPGRDRREASRRQGAQRLRRPARAGPGPRRGFARPRPRRTPSAAGGRPADRPGRRAIAAGRARRRGCRPRPASAAIARVHPPEVSEALGWVLAAIAEEGAEPWVHSCAPETPLGLLRGAGARGLSVDLDQMSAADHEVLAEALDAGECGRAGRRAVAGACRAAGRRSGHRARAALARHGRSRSGNDQSLSGGFANLWTGWFVVRVDEAVAERPFAAPPRT